MMRGVTLQGSLRDPDVCEDMVHSNLIDFQKKDKEGMANAKSY